MLVALAFFVVTILTFARLAWRFAERQRCAASDIASAGQLRPSKEPLGRRVVVIGSSVAGLLAARVCSTHFEEVILLDAEACSTDPTVKRTRVKQHSQLHLFLGLLSPALKSLFPSWHVDMQKAGGTFCPLAPNSYRAGGFTRLTSRFTSRETAPCEQLYIGRESFEALLRRLVISLREVKASVGMVTRLVPSPDRKTISGVVVRRPDGTSETISADMVIDASGTTNGSIHWLRREGYAEPVKHSYDPRIRYCCMTWQLMPATIAKIDALKDAPKWSETGHLGSAFVGNHASSFMRIDGDRVRCLYQTILDDNNDGGNDLLSTEDMREAIHREPYKPASLAALDIIWNAERDDGAPPPEIKHVNIGICYRVEYNTRDMPTNLVPLGDTLCRVNPIFGQGCTKAMIDALSLDHVLRASNDGNKATIPARFLDLHEKRTQGIWRSVKAHDYGLETTIPLKGETLDVGSFQRRFNKWVLSASHKDPLVGEKMTLASGQLNSWLSLWTPAFLLRCAAVNWGLL